MSRKWPAMLEQQRGHFRLIHTDTYPVACHPWLRHFEKSAADPVTVADAYFRVRQAIDREVFSELPVDEVASRQLLLPIAVGIDLIDKHGATLAAMAGQIPLSVAIDIEPTRHARAVDPCLPNGGMNRLALPGDIARQTDVDRKQTSHHVSQR